jgi:hypothetical protein
MISTASSAQQQPAGQHAMQGTGDISTLTSGVLGVAPRGTHVKRWGNTNDPAYGDVHFYNYRDDCQVRLACCSSCYKGRGPYAAGCALMFVALALLPPLGEARALGPGWLSQHARCWHFNMVQLLRTCAWKRVSKPRQCPRKHQTPGCKPCVGMHP